MAPQTVATRSVSIVLCIVNTTDDCIMQTSGENSWSLFPDLQNMYSARSVVTAPVSALFSIFSANTEENAHESKKHTKGNRNNRKATGNMCYFIFLSKIDKKKSHRKQKCLYKGDMWEWQTPLDMPSFRAPCHRISSCHNSSLHPVKTSFLSFVFFFANCKYSECILMLYSRCKLLDCVFSFFSF